MGALSQRLQFTMAARLLLAFAALLLPLVLFSAWSYQQSLRHRQDVALDDAVGTAQTMAVVVHGLLSDLNSTILAMSLALGQDPRPLDQANVGPYLQTVAAQNPIVRALFLMDPEGRVVATQSAEGVGVDLSGRPYTQRLLGGKEFVLSEVVQGVQSGEPTVTMARTVRGPSGELRGMLVVAFYPERLTSLFPGPFPSDATLTITDSRGWVIYSSAMPDLAWEERDRSGSPLVRGALAGEVTSDTDVTSPNDGDARLEVAVPVPEYGWVLAYSRSMASVAGALQDFYRRQVLALGSVSLIALLAAYVISQSLSGPLRRLAEQTRAFGRGDGARPASLLPLEGPPEVRTLAGALNQMTVEIDQRFAEQESAKAALREAEARYRGIFEHAVEGIFQTGFDGRIRTVNLAGARMLGYASTEEFLAESPDIRQIYVDPARLEDFVRSMERDGEVTGFELEARRKDGTRCWLLVNARATRDDGGRIEQVDGLVSDITERKRGEQERDEILAREQAARADAERAADRITRLQDITVALSEALTPGQVMDVITEHGVAALAAYAGGVALVTPEGAELEVVRAVGYPPDIPARALRYPVTADNPPAEAVRTGAPVWVEVVAEHESRFPRHAAAAIEGSGSQAIAAIPLMEADRAIGALALSFGEVRRFSAEDRAFLIALARQCSQALARARLYEAERAARAEAEEANRAKDEFLSTLSHELRTPLTPILGWIAMLRRGSLDEKAQQRAFEIIERSAKAQVQLVADLLDVSRIVTGKLHLEPRPVDFDDVVRASAAVVQPAADAKRIALTLSLPPRSTLLMGDPDRLQQVVWNLLSNAVKFTPEGGQVTVRLGQVERDAVLSVSDSGIGIPPAFLPYVFDRFRQADATSTRRFGGLGLGLAIVRHLVELHGGSVTAASEGDGRGATFAVRLPLAAPVLEERRDEPDPEVGTANGEASTMLAGLHVLVLDDETDTREFLRTLLETYQADVTMAASSAEALAALDRTRPDVVLADIAMPGQDGYEFIARMRARPLEDGGGIPAVAITAYASGSDRARALAAGFQEHLPKPVDGDEVLSVVQRLAARTDGAMR